MLWICSTTSVLRNDALKLNPPNFPQPNRIRTNNGSNVKVVRGQAHCAGKRGPRTPGGTRRDRWIGHRCRGCCIPPCFHGELLQYQVLRPKLRLWRTCLRHETVRWANQRGSRSKHDAPNRIRPLDCTISRCEQSTPVNPSKHWHCALFTHCPRELQSFGQPAEAKPATEITNASPIALKTAIWRRSAATFICNGKLYRIRL